MLCSIFYLRYQDRRAKAPWLSLCPNGSAGNIYSSVVTTGKQRRSRYAKYSSTASLTSIRASMKSPLKGIRYLQVKNVHSTFLFFIIQFLFSYGFFFFSFYQRYGRRCKNEEQSSVAAVPVDKHSSTS